MSEQNQIPPDTEKPQSDLSATIAWLQSIVVLTAAVLRLGIAEISLAREDFGRLILVCLLIVPMILLTWLAFGVLAAWIVFELTLSATWGFTAFAAIQLITMLILFSKVKTYRHSLGLPATRAQILTIIDEVRHETSRQAAADREK